MVISLLIAWFLLSAVGAWLVGRTLRGVRWGRTVGRIAALVQRNYPALEVIGATRAADGTLSLLLEGREIARPARRRIQVIATWRRPA